MVLNHQSINTVLPGVKHMHTSSRAQDRCRRRSHVVSIHPSNGTTLAHLLGEAAVRARRAASLLELHLDTVAAPARRRRSTSK